MMTPSRTHLFLTAFFLAGIFVGEARSQDAADDIAESEIVSLQREMDGAGEASSKTRRRRAYKGVVRDAESLLKSSPTAPNRYRVLEIMFQSQKRMLSMENSEENRDALLETCARLVKAPEEFADLRLEADLLLMERDLSARNADVKVRTEALVDFIARYRHTPGEKKSLMMASLIAPKLEAFELEKQIFRTMDGRFAGDYDLIEWRRKNNGNSHERVLFTGSFKRADGTSLTFPIDAIGHTIVLVFWSKDTPEIATRFAEIKDLQTRFPGQMNVFSLNVDELADGGEKTLRSLGLDWTVMFLPGGRKSQTYRVVARKDPMVVRINAHGHAFLPSSLIDELLKEVSMEQNLDGSRYLAQLQSLLVGEFLLPRDIPDPVAGSIPESEFKAIQDCFVEAPLRYRLTRSQALANYRKAETLSRDTIARHPKAPDLWRVRNCRIIALLGMWKLAFEPRHLGDATAESRLAMAATTPDGAKVVPRFCLATRALRRGDRAPHLVLSELAGDDASAPGFAAAAILTMNINAVDLHAEFREKLLAFTNDDPALWPVVSFLTDQNHRFRMFKYNYYMPASLARRIVRADLRSNAADLDAPADTSGPIGCDFETLEGERLSLPQATDGKLTILMFVEPPAAGEGEFPTLINGAVTEDSRGRRVETPGVMQHAFQVAEQHVHNEIKIIAAFPSDDTDGIRALMKKHAWPCEVVTVPGGLTNPLIRRLGILSADRVPNIVLLRPDGTIVWKLSGLVHPQVRSEGLGETLGVISRALRAQISRYEMERSIAALEKGKYREAVRLFSGPFPPPERPNPDGWTAPRFHGRALAHIQLKRWEPALADLNAAIEAHELVLNRKKPCACHRVGELLLTKAMILEQLGRAQEAEGARTRAGAASFTHPRTRYGSLHERIEAAIKFKERK